MIAKSPYVTPHIAAQPKYLGLSERQVRRMCENGILPARRPGGPRGRWQILRAGLLNHMMQSYPNPKAKYA